MLYILKKNYRVIHIKKKKKKRNTEETLKSLSKHKIMTLIKLLRSRNFFMGVIEGNRN